MKQLKAILSRPEVRHADVAHVLKSISTIGLISCDRYKKVCGGTCLAVKTPLDRAIHPTIRS